MISVREAILKVEENSKALPYYEMPILNAQQFVLATDLKSDINVPGFRQSAMDGFAFSFEKWDGNSAFKVIGKVAAGDDFRSKVETNEAVRIFTGAKVPDTCDSVIIQEHTEIIDNELYVNSPNLKIGSNIRPVGSQTAKDSTAASKGILIDAGTQAFLAGLGIDKVLVHQKPKVAIITTGSELVKPGEALKAGQVYESNSFALKTGLREAGIDHIEHYSCIDEDSAIVNAFHDALQTCDMILFTGGVSVGEYDLVPKIVSDSGAQILFHKVAQKPGKPLLFAKKKDNKLIFGLPGNPASVLSCFYVYVWPAIQKMKGISKIHLPSFHLPLINEIKRKPGREQFYKARVASNEVEILSKQLSYQMDAFAVANTLVQINSEVERVLKGEMVQTILLPSFLHK